jgi:hypothetical protein
LDPTAPNETMLVGTLPLVGKMVGILPLGKMLVGFLPPGETLVVGFLPVSHHADIIIICCVCALTHI